MSDAMTTRLGSDPRPRTALGQPEFRKLLVDFVKRRVPPADVDDVVQTILCDALAAASPPEDRDELRKWLVGIARHKVADFHRKSKREAPIETPEQEAAPAPLEAREMVRWAEEQAASTRDARQTLEWMAREGEGEKLESIAEDEQLPAARVRQRVSRLRRWMKQRWLAELAAVAALALLAFIAYRILRPKDEAPEARPDHPELLPRPEPQPESPVERARALRAEARERCEAREWQPCIERLDQAKGLDPAGDAASDVQALRDEARRAQEPLPLQEKKEEIDSKKELTPLPKVAPSSTATPPTTAKPKSPPPVKPKGPSKESSSSDLKDSVEFGTPTSTGIPQQSKGDFGGKK
jgi:RNA polymerase sigma factor (sigma-70 family)